ncbi:MAG: hypothetical protein K8T26_16440 [Lentisphaerae bacterium]|nr:hypothetical protein [Lentisphaerota bacterium]
MHDPAGTLRAGFAEIEITPPPGTCKVGWVKRIYSDRVLDPLFARVAVLESGGQRLAFIQVDTLSIRWTQVSDMRRRLAAAFGFPPDRIMVCATHNHAGPAVTGSGDALRDDTYLETLVQRVVACFGDALARLEIAEAGFGLTHEWNVAHNRRVVMRDGTARTHGTFKDPDALCYEGPIDPEVAVLGVRKPGGAWIGCLVNFACHATHGGGDGTLSAGFPGVLAQALKSAGCPATLFLNGAAGNMHTANPSKGGEDPGMEAAGAALAKDVQAIWAQLTWRSSLRLSSASRTIELPFRAITDDEIRGTARGAQRFVDPRVYDKVIPALVAKIRKQRTNLAEVQVFFLDELALVGIPAEYFVEYGLQVKEAAHPRHALIVGYANGMVGYVPTRAAFARGGYETTFSRSSKLAPEAGDMLAQAALTLIRSEP